jgi:hypothetical protein
MKIKYRYQLGELMEHLGLKGPAAEIGVAEGRNAEVMIKWPSVTKLYLIDAWKQLKQKGDAGLSQAWHDDNYVGMMYRTDSHKEKRVVLRGLTEWGIAQIPDDSLALAYVDADHSYEGCLRDLKAIWPKIKKGGVLAGHDYLNEAYGVRRAVQEFAGFALESDKDIMTVHIIEDEHPSMASFWIRKEVGHNG